VEPCKTLSGVIETARHSDRDIVGTHVRITNIQNSSKALDKIKPTESQGKRIKTPVHYWLYSSQGQVDCE
jgi:hypothetical protein